MRFEESEKLANEHPRLRSLIELCDAELSKLDVAAVVVVERWAQRLGEDRHRLESVLDGYSDLGLLVSGIRFECECGVLNAANDGDCTSCGDSTRAAPPRKALVFSDSAKTAIRARTLAETKVNAPVPTRETPPTANVGIITALPYEFAAMKLMLDDPQQWFADVRGTRQPYTVGTIASLAGGLHEVVLTLLPDVGNNQAAARAERLLQQVPSVQRIIMCGIAGGVPRPGVPDDDVRLGDIVYTNAGGVVQYDFGKDDGKWEVRARPRPPSASLLETSRLLEAGAAVGDRPWETYLARGARLEGSARPPDDHDAKGRTIAYPVDAGRRPGVPRVFQGVIASSNVLLKNAERREQLRQQFSVKAVEMEGSGIADATWTAESGYFVVRGIVDYCDPEKGDHWHRCASVAAAAYTRALIEAMAVLG